MSTATHREVELSKLVHKETTGHDPSDKEKQVVTDTIDLFRRTADARNRNFEYFDGINLIDYINDSVLRFNTNVYERDDLEDWQAAVHEPFTRNKVLTILGKVMQILPMAQFIGRGEDDAQKGILLTNLYEYVEELDDYEEFMTHFLLECIVKGTAVGIEDIEKVHHIRRDVKGVADKITVTTSEEDTTKLYASIIPLEEFYPSSVTIRKIKDMPHAFWRTVKPYSKFCEVWNGYKRYEIVAPKRTYNDQEDRPYYADYIGMDVPDGSVELIRFYDKAHDQYIILANGIWLNPIYTGDAAEEISPMPWNHKELPMFEVKFDFFGDWFYGKSLPDRLKALQDVLNVLTNMLLDQSFLTIFPPLLTNGFDDIEDDYLRPGRRTPVDTQGLPINQAFMTLDLGTPSGWHQFILDYTRKIMEEASVDKVSQGVAGVGGRTTAQEIRVAADGVSSMLQMFARMINYAVKRKAYLKAANFLQFGMNQEAPMLRQVFGENASEQAEHILGVFKFDNAVLSEGKRGSKVIEIYKDKASLPTKVELQARAAVSKADSGKQLEIVALPPEYLRNFMFDVKMVANPKNEASKEIEKALQLEKVRVYMSFFPELVDKAELAATTAEKMGDDPAKIFKPEAIGLAPVEKPKEADPGMSTEPNDNTANNMARSARGGDMGSGDLAALQQQMLG